MNAGQRVNPNELLGKARLSVHEMTDLIAAMVSDLPSVKSVAVDGQGGEISVALVTGKRIGIAAIPVAHAMNESMNSRLQALDDLFKRCA
ncbi:MAG: hypothetical protein LWW93_14490 [Hyphomicrobiales bacterium]|nr:hypothetical protein [Hyphomicrobiales bacterium]